MSVSPLRGRTRWAGALPARTRKCAPLPGATVWVADGSDLPPFPVIIDNRIALFSGEGTLSVQVSTGFARDVGFAGEGALSVQIVPKHQAEAAFAGAGTFTIDTRAILARAVAMAAEGALTVDRVLRYQQSVDFGGSGSLSVNVVIGFARNVAFAGEGTLTVLAVSVQPRPVGFAGSGSLSVATAPRMSRDVAFAGAGSLSVVSFPRFAQPVAFAGAGTLSVTSLPRFAAAADFAGQGTLSVVVVAVTKTDASDNFNRGSLGSDWGVMQAVGPNPPQMVASTSVRAGAPAAGANTLSQQIIYNTAHPMLTLNQGVEGQFLDGLFADYSLSGVVWRFKTGGTVATTTCMLALGSDWGGNNALFTLINGELVNRASITASAFNTANDTIVGESVGNVNTVKRIRAGVTTTVASWTDSGAAFPYDSTNQYSGFYLASANNVYGTLVAGPRMDNWRGYDI